MKCHTSSYLKFLSWYHTGCALGDSCERRSQTPCCCDQQTLIVPIQPHGNTPSYRTQHTVTLNHSLLSSPELGSKYIQTTYLTENCMEGRSNSATQCRPVNGITGMPLRIHTTSSLYTRTCKFTTFNWCRSLNTPESMKECSKGSSRNLQFLPGQWCEQKYVYTCHCLALLNAEQRRPVRTISNGTCGTTALLTAASEIPPHSLLINMS